MTERVWLGQFNIVGGDAREEGPYAAVSAARSVADSIADLYIILQPGRSDRDHLCAEVMETATRTFGRAQYSVTGNLLLCLGAAHRHLRAWNDASMAVDKLAVGVSCLAVNGANAYLAQAGASAVFYRHHGRVEKLEPYEEAAQAGLGERDTVSPSFHRLSLQKGDLLLMLSGGFAARAEEAIAHFLSLAPEQGLPQIYRYARAEQDCGAILLSVLDDPAAAEPETETEGYAAALSQAGPHPPRGPQAQPAPQPGRPRGMASPLGRHPLRRVQAQHPDAGIGVLRVLGSELPREPRTADVPTIAPQAPPAAGMNLRVGTRHPSFRGLGGVGGRRRAWQLPAALTASLALVAVLVWLGGPALLQSGRSQRFRSLLSSAQNELTAAQAEPDLSKRRELLNQAQTNADEAKRLRPQDQSAASEASSVAGALSVMDAVYNLPDVPQLADLSKVGLSPSTAVEIAAGDRFYVLDVSAGKVFAVSASPAAPPADPEVIYEDGAQIDGIRAGKAHHIAWQPPAGPGDQGTLLVLDAERHLFGRSRGDLRSIPLRGVEQWRTDTAMAFAGGNLYVLDATGGLVWRYAPSSDGFDTDPAPAVARSDIRDATQMSVVGGIFLTGRDARIRRFLDGQETAFQQAGIDRAPVAPDPPLFDPSSGLLYIADRGNSRVIVLEGDGRFKRQLLHARLAGLRGLAVDAGNNRLVGVIGQALVAIPLPS